MIDAAIELTFVQFSDRFIHIVIAKRLIIGVRQWIQIHHFLHDGIEQIRWNFVAANAALLTAVGSGGKRISCRVALKSGIGGSRYIGIDQKALAWIAKSIVAEIAISHGRRGTGP